MSRAGEHLERVPVESREGWRDWLALHHAQPKSVWAVTWKKGHALHVPQRALVEEALAWGWIDSLPRKLDEGRTMLLVSPRRAGSNWSAVNRDIVARLVAERRMAPPGLAAVARAQADGTWMALEGVEALEIPPDLAAAFAQDPVAEGFFRAFPRSSVRGILEWIAAAKRAETRAARIAETVAKAAENRKANHPAGRDLGPVRRDGA